MTNSLDPRDYATFRHVWDLYPSEIAKLDRYFMKKYKLRELIEAIDTKSHEFKTLLNDKNICWEIEFMQCSYKFLCDLDKTYQGLDCRVSVSFRYSTEHSFAIALIRKPRNS